MNYRIFSQNPCTRGKKATTTTTTTTTIVFLYSSRQELLADFLWGSQLWTQLNGAVLFVTILPSGLSSH